MKNYFESVLRWWLFGRVTKTYTPQNFHEIPSNVQSTLLEGNNVTITSMLGFYTDVHETYLANHDGSYERRTIVDSQ